MKFITILLTILLLKSCGNTKATAMQNNENITEALSGKYNVSILNSDAITIKTLTITFDEKTNKVSGFSGCNSFFGTYKTKKDSIIFSELGATRMFCENAENKIEQTMLDALSKTTSFHIDNNILSLQNDNDILLKASKDPTQKIAQENHYTIEYSAITRGSYKNISINKKSIKVAHERDSKPTSRVCTQNQWGALITAIKTIDIEKIPSLKAPSEKRFFDGAAIAKLKIVYNGDVYETESFDDGNPPKEIAVLVKEILSISENIEKQ